MRLVARTLVVGVAAVGFLAPTGARASLIDDAVVYYDFEGSGQTVSDRSGGTPIDLQLGSTTSADANDPTRTTGRVGMGLSFDGGDFATSITDKAALDFNADDPFSVAGWFKRTKADGGTQKFLLAKMDPSGTYPGWFLAWRDSDIGSDQNKLLFFMRDNQGSSGNGRLDVKSVAVTDTDWVHIGVTYDGSSDPSGVNFYLNGDPLAVSTSADDLSDFDVTDNAAPLNIGGRNDVGSWHGLADNVGVWDRVLSQAEVKQATVIPEPCTVLIWSLLGGLGIALGCRRKRRT